MSVRKNIDRILSDWPFETGQLSARDVKGADGRNVLQMRIDMGLMQMEIEGRPDGARPSGADSYLDYLIAMVIHKGDDFELDEEECIEVDREFVQYYHRRICWLTLKEYRKAVLDAEHTLQLMDFCREHSPDEQWTLSHEQYRPFVLFHHTQATALAELDDKDAEAAISAINTGLDRFRDIYEEIDAEEEFEEDELVQRLEELRESLREKYDVGQTLNEKLADAVATEQYELAAQLRDEINRRGSQKQL